MKLNHLVITAAAIAVLAASCRQESSQNVNLGLERVEEIVVEQVGSIITSELPESDDSEFMDNEPRHCSIYESLRPSRNLRDPNKMHIHIGREMGLKEAFRKNADFLAVRDSFLENNILQIVPDGEHYRKKKMRYSYPYLTPEAITLLIDISTRFHEKLQKRNMPSYAIQLTSCLRTLESQSKLRGSNNNATRDTTSHAFGASFDISYWEFIREEDGRLCRYKQLQRILNQTIREMRDEKRCLVIKETGQFCFHCTVIK